MARYIMTAFILRSRIEALTEKYGGITKAGKAIKVDTGYLVRLRDGEKRNPSDETLFKLGLVKVITYKKLSNADKKKGLYI